ncbi:alkaline phosphatase family protein [Streptomyces sp. H39-C1]|uniref:alkaline phosphatase family protein n=1 Tax=Streptomyces sp. H39-C1 TaxID=3004355 RepID=UPI0022AFD81A|nr:alkaline phosphatase family protein [Streptomyces sp. H39-C1]MCZ4103228.1 alkaline phosphatase family protein [Streptomyces sp. H39-C1]
MRRRITASLTALACATPLAIAAASPVQAATDHHVLLISVDGLHAADLRRYVATHPGSALAALSRRGTTYTDARGSEPSDSFPGLLALVTGGTPRSTGVYYDDSYDRRLSPPGSGCATVGTEVVFDESIDRDPDALDGGGGIDPAKLPLDPAKGCTPVYPHQFLRTNTVFEVARQAGLRTAWSDKHPAYDLVNGPSGKGVQDAYNPEINAVAGTAATEGYDDLKAAAVRNEIDGKDHAGTHTVGVPAVFGLNFQAVSVAQKDAAGGYTDGGRAPSAELADALEHTDRSIGALLARLTARGLDKSTQVILTAKHGQSPTDRAKLKLVDKKLLTTAVNGVTPGLVAQTTADDVALLWLTDHSKAQAAAAALRAHAGELNIDRVLVGKDITRRFGNPAKDSRTPDVMVLPRPGTVYAKPGATKIAEHGGFSADDTHVALLVAGPGVPRGEEVDDRVTTTQVAPTIVRFLGLDPRSLDAVRAEHTRVLPKQ